MFRRTDDPIADFNAWDAEREAQLEKLPICADCGERITTDFCYCINDEYICPDCMDSGYRKWTVDCCE